MAFVNTSHAVSARPSERLSGLMATLGAALTRRRVYARTLAELRQLSDRELADLGLSRLSIVDVAREAAYGR